MATGHSAGAHRSLVGIEVLVAADEFLIAADVAIALRDLGCIVLGPAASCEEALALLERARPDIGELEQVVRLGAELGLMQNRRAAENLLNKAALTGSQNVDKAKKI